MKFFSITAIALVSASALAIATPALAGPDTHYVGTDTFTVNSTDPGLVLNVDYLNPTLNFTQGLGDTTTIDLGWIYTNETDVGSDDKVAKPITLAFNFSNPSGLGGSIGGTTVGQSFVFGLYQDGLVTWNGGGNGTLTDASGDLVNFHVNGGVLGSGWGGLDHTQGLKVTASFTTAAQGAVPEPASWALMLGGFGAIGSALRSHRRKTAVTFA